MIEPLDTRLRLCAITDDLRDGVDGLVARARAAEDGGASMLLLRVKHADARVLVEVGRALVAALEIPVLVSERLDVALAVGAAGVHLTAASLPVQAVRPLVPQTFLVGGSVSDASDLEWASHADFVTIGPVFGDTDVAIGIERFTSLARATARPVIAIGGVDASVVPALCTAGACGVAVIRAVMGAPDVSAAAAALRSAVDAALGDAPAAG